MIPVVRYLDLTDVLSKLRFSLSFTYLFLVWKTAYHRPTYRVETAKKPSFPAGFEGLWFGCGLKKLATDWLKVTPLTRPTWPIHIPITQLVLAKFWSKMFLSSFTLIWVKFSPVRQKVERNNSAHSRKGAQCQWSNSFIISHGKHNSTLLRISKLEVNNSIFWFGY